MIVRVVQMHFKADCVADFKAMFDEVKEGIRHQPGCSLLELFQDKADEQRFYTYSYWDNEESLNNYRKSALFEVVWPKTKAMFDQKPIAHSLEKVHSLL